MELDYLREFVVLAQTCQFQEAANRLFMSQSSLSKHIKTIEKDLGAPLLIRTTRKVELSDFGKAFLPYAIQIADLQHDYTVNLLPEYKNDPTNITIGGIPLVNFYKLDYRFMEWFSQRYPDQQITFAEHNDQTLCNMLANGRCDLIVVGDLSSLPEEDYCAEVYAEDTIVAVIAQDHPLAARSCLNVTDLLRCPLLQLGKLDIIHLLDPDLPPASYIMSRTPLLMDSVRRGIGIGVLTYHCAISHPLPGVVVLPIHPVTSMQLLAVYSRRRKKNQACVKSIVDYIGTRRREIEDRDNNDAFQTKFPDA